MEQMTDLEQGLSQQEAASRAAQGLINGEEEVKTRSVGQIIRKNIFTPFNLLNIILGALIISVGSWRNLLFLGVMLCNTLVSIMQELAAKKTIDKLSLIAAPKARVVRDGQEQALAVADIVWGDLLQLGAGNQICADAVLAQGSCEVNESLITGESEPVVKNVGDHLLSGSFIVSGNCRAQVEHVGKDNYAQKITGSAKYLKRPNSEIMTSINRIIKCIGIILLPVGIALFLKEMFITHTPYTDAVVGTVAALTGMIPEGLVLLTSGVLAFSVVRLAMHQALVQELYSIETLARVDTLCLDKTGTITEGCMQVDQTLLLGSLTEEEALRAAGALAHTLHDDNPTSLAIQELCPQAPDWQAAQQVPFSSARKWSGVYFETQGCWVLGAGEFVLGDDFCGDMQEQAQAASAKGQRVLVLAHADTPFAGEDGKALPAELQPVALFFLSDKIRANARETLQYFADQGVDLKVISGDNAVTVANIARKAGLEAADRWVDATTLQTDADIQQAVRDYAVFGRVTPQQKLQIVKALKADGHTVAMTGDGVNDVLALRESDCSVAMASGSDAARTVSQIVLLNSDFASMPRIVAEGRRSVNNLQRSSSLYMVKAMFNTIIALLFVFLQTAYPFQPIHFTFINFLTIGAPSVILALEPNRERIRGSFIRNVIKKSIPGALTMALNVLLLEGTNFFLHFSEGEVSTLAVVLTGFTGLMILFRVCMPFNGKHAVLFGLMSVGFLLGLAVLGPKLLELVPLTAPMILVLVPLVIAAVSTFMMLLHLVERILMRHVE